MCIDANFTNANRGRCVLGDDPFQNNYVTSLGDCCEQADLYNATTYQFNETSGQCALYTGSFVGTECGLDIITSSMGNIVPLQCSNYTIHQGQCITNQYFFTAAFSFDECCTFADDYNANGYMYDANTRNCTVYNETTLQTLPCSKVSAWKNSTNNTHAVL